MALSNHISRNAARNAGTNKNKCVCRQISLAWNVSITEFCVAQAGMALFSKVRAWEKGAVDVGGVCEASCMGWIALVGKQEHIYECCEVVYWLENLAFLTCSH